MLKKSFILFLFSQILFSQEIKGVVLDSVTKSPIELTNIFFTDSYFGTFTNERGEFKLDIDKKNTEFMISNIGYENKIIKLVDYKDKLNSLNVFYLNPKIEIIDEVIISKKKVNYSFTKKVLSESEKTLYYAFQFGSENITYVKNDFFKKGKIKKVFLDLRKVKDFKEPCKKCKVEYIVSLNLKFYEFDAKNKIPGNELYSKNIIVELKNETYKLGIDVDSLKINFPKNGVCIGIETINTRYKNTNNRFGLIAPAIKFTNTKSNSEILSWSRYRNEGWKINVDSNINMNNMFFKTLKVDLDVKFEK